MVIPTFAAASAAVCVAACFAVRCSIASLKHPAGQRPVAKRSTAILDLACQVRSLRWCAAGRRVCWFVSCSAGVHRHGRHITAAESTGMPRTRLLAGALAAGARPCFTLPRCDTYDGSSEQVHHRAEETVAGVAYQRRCNTVRTINGSMDPRICASATGSGTGR